MVSEDGELAAFYVVEKGFCNMEDGKELMVKSTDFLSVLVSFLE